MTEEILSVSWSQVKVRRRCEKQWAYKYLDRLQKKAKSRAPYLGNWLHRCLETYYESGDWRIGHKEYLKEWNSLFEEEREALSEKSGPLPDVVKRIMRSYLWYWKNDGWKVLATEYEFEVMIGSFELDGVKIIVHANGKADLVVEDELGEIRWVVDHKSTASIPDPGAFHAMDPQLMLYPVGVKPKFGPVAGVQYNYLRSRPASIPKINKNGSISKRKIVTDYPTVLRFLKENNLDPADYSDFLRPLRKGSPLLKRYKLPRETAVTKTVIRDFISTARDIKISQGRKSHVRNITKDCATMCDFHDLCRGELNGYDMSHLRKAKFELREKHGLDTEDEYEEAELED